MCPQIGARIISSCRHRNCFKKTVGQYVPTPYTEEILHQYPPRSVLEYQKLYSWMHEVHRCRYFFYFHAIPRGKMIRDIYPCAVVVLCSMVPPPK